MDGIQNIITLLNPPPWQQRKWGLEGLKVTPPAEVQPKGQLGLPDAPTPLSLIDPGGQVELQSFTLKPCHIES